MPDVGHAATDKGFINRRACNFAHEFGIIWVVGAADDGLVDVGQIDVNYGGVLGISVGLEQRGFLQPVLHGFDAARQCACVLVAVGNHAFEQHDVALQVFDNGGFIECYGAACGRALGRCVGQLERLLHLEVGQAFNFEDAAREDVFLARFFYREQPLFDGVQRYGVHQVAQGDARLHFAVKAHQHALGHV